MCLGCDYLSRKRVYNEPKQGEVWIVHDSGGFKQKPVVVVSKKELVVAEIKEHSGDRGLFSYEFDWMHVGLNRKSEIRLSRLYSLSPSEFSKRLGRMKRSDLFSLIRKIKSIIE